MTNPNFLTKCSDFFIIYALKSTEINYFYVQTLKLNNNARN